MTAAASKMRQMKTRMVIQQTHHKHQSTCRISAVKTGGEPGVWRCLKRVNYEFNAVHRLFHSLGYSTYYRQARQGHRRSNSQRNSTQNAIYEEDMYQHLLIEFAEWMLRTTYIPPRQGLLAQTLSTTIAMRNQLGWSAMATAWRLQRRSQSTRKCSWRWRSTHKPRNGPTHQHTAAMSV